MNGIVSQNMRNLGANYKINFGLTLPLLKKIAEEIPADAQLANALWNDTAVRESTPQMNLTKMKQKSGSRICPISKLPIYAVKACSADSDSHLEKHCHGVSPTR